MNGTAAARPRVLVVFGTRPEAIKLAPVVQELEASPLVDCTVVVTGQHRAMLDGVNRLFGIRPARDLDLVRHRPDLAGITSGVVEGIGRVVSELRPDLVVVQGDTTTVFAAALAAFYAQVPVAHVEAGLRTGRRYDPYPEEINRRLTTALTVLHLAPTPAACQNLLAEGIARQDVVVTGNTVIDALLDVVSRDLPLVVPELAPVLEHERTILVTSHRRESWGAPMRRTAGAVRALAERFPDVLVVLPAHANPGVRDVLLPPLHGLANVLVTEPLEYSDLARVMARSTLVITDSGGIQEEAPALGKPVLVLRETTERPEAVAAGTVRLVGTDPARILHEATRLLTDAAAYEAMARAVNPYGDGLARFRVVRAIEHLLGLGPAPEQFVPVTLPSRAVRSAA